MKKLKTDASLLQSCVSVSVTASELRIGNKLLVGGGLKEDCIVLSIYDKLIGYETETRKGECNIEWLSTIPITEEWLIKIGYEKMPSGTYLQQNSGNFIWFEKGLKCSIAGEYYAEKIKYIHQLQNLHYALNGSELQIGNLTEH